MEKEVKQDSRCQDKQKNKSTQMMNIGECPRKEEGQAKETAVFGTESTVDFRKGKTAILSERRGYLL